MYSKRVIRRRQIAVIFIVMAIVCIILGSVLFGSIRAKAASADNFYKYYTSIQIQKGDTLWSISESYWLNEYADRKTYIQEICSLNHITEDDIHAGQYLTVPYYSKDYLE